MKTITLQVRADDAEPILLEAAENAAKFGGWCDYITPQVRNSPGWGGMLFPNAKREWFARFLKAKRIVEAFGVEYEQTTEAETMTVDFDTIGGRTKVIKVPGIGPLGWRTGGEPDYKHPRPSYRGGVHAEACRQAATRVVRKWRQAIDGERLAA